MLSLQNQEFKEHPENFKSVGDFTLDGEGGSDISKPNAKKKLAGKTGASRQHSLSGYTLALFYGRSNTFTISQNVNWAITDDIDEDTEADPMDEPEAIDRSGMFKNCPLTYTATL